LAGWAKPALIAARHFGRETAVQSVARIHDESLESKHPTMQRHRTPNVAPTGQHLWPVGIKHAASRGKDSES
jgi:hypothetical protein